VGIAEGRKAAAGIDKYVMRLPAAPPAKSKARRDLVSV
jgi:hypothetical protein